MSRGFLVGERSFMPGQGPEVDHEEVEQVTAPEDAGGDNLATPQMIEPAQYKTDCLPPDSHEPNPHLPTYCGGTVPRRGTQ